MELIIALIAGLIFRLIQPATIRVFTILPTFFILGLLTSIFPGYMFIFFGIGMCLKGLLMGLWHFFVFKIVVFLIGMAIGYSFIAPLL